MVLPLVLFRADASLTIGSGHVRRCVTLADRLAARGAEIHFAIRSQKGDLIGEVEERGHRVLRLPAPSQDAGGTSAEMDDVEDVLAALEVAAWDRPADWVIVDHYRLAQAWERAVRSKATRIMAIDDLSDRPHDADILLDQNLVAGFEDRYAGLVGQSCLTLLGPRYALLANNYRIQRTHFRREADRIERILVYFGAADQHLTLMTAQVLSNVPDHFTATIILTEENNQHQAVSDLAANNHRINVIAGLPDLATAMAESDLFIGASGTTSWERLCLGLKAIVVTLAPNQTPLAQELARRGFIEWLGDMETVSAQRLEGTICDQLSKPSTPLLSAAMMDIVDGLGSERVCDALLHGPHDPLLLRLAEEGDRELVLTWVNDAGTRRYAFTTGSISAESHAGWFASRLNNPEVLFLIAQTTYGIPTGQVRFERQADASWEISYLVAPAFRGRGLARKMLAAAIDRLAELHVAPVITGLVKLENHASLRIFDALGFVRTPLPEDSDVVRFTRLS